MNVRFLKHIFAVMAALLLASCSQNEVVDDMLPEGVYPLEIGSVSLGVNVQPWSTDAPQLRASENEDGTGSVWTDGDIICVKTEGASTAGTFACNGNGVFDCVAPTYWTKTEENVIAWYPADETISFSDQSKQLAYVLQATVENAPYRQAVDLNFKHRLAKIRVVLTGDKVSVVQEVKIKSFTTCTHHNGEPQGSDEGWITMMPVSDGDAIKYWEANVLPGKDVTAFQVNGVTGSITSVTPEAGKRHEIKIEIR